MFNGSSTSVTGSSVTQTSSHSATFVFFYRVRVEFFEIFDPTSLFPHPPRVTLCKRRTCYSDKRPN